MKRILAPRGGGRTYAICEYAVKNNCNILVPMQSTAMLCAQEYIKEIARNLDIQYRKYSDNPHGFTVDLESRERGEYRVHIFVVSRLPNRLHGWRLEDKPLVVDDIDRCFKLMCFPNVRIEACSLMTYYPNEVALTQPISPQEAPLQDECVCDSLV